MGSPEEAVVRQPSDEPYDRIQNSAAAIGLATLIGSGAGDTAAALGMMAYMQPQSALTDSLLPRTELVHQNGVAVEVPWRTIGRNQGGQFVETRRPDGTISQRYETGACAELDNNRRLTSMVLPGPRGVTVRMEYTGDSHDPSALVLVRGAKQGDLRIAAGPGIRFGINHANGSVSVRDDGRRTESSYAINGDRHDIFDNGSMRECRYHHSDQSNHTTWTNPTTGSNYTVVDRADGSGHTDSSDGTRSETRFAPGTNLTYRIPGGTAEQGRYITLSDVREISYELTELLDTNARLTTGDGRMFQVTAIGSGLRGEPTAVDVRQLSDGKIRNHVRG
jgi:hypothetical protein